MGKSSIPVVGVLLLCFLVSFSEAEYRKYKDPKLPLNRRIKDLMSRMSLEEKIGQMTQLERLVATPEAMTKYFIGKLLITLLLKSSSFLYCLMLSCFFESECVMIGLCKVYYVAVVLILQIKCVWWCWCPTLTRH